MTEDTPFQEFDSVRLVALRDRRFDRYLPFYQRNPRPGDTGAVQEVGHGTNE